MKIVQGLCVLTLCALTLPGPAQAQQLTQDSFLLRSSGDLVALCSAAQNDPLYTAAVHFCQGFVVGVARVLNEEDSAHGAAGLFCLPNPPPTRNQGIADFVQWAKSPAGQTNRQPTDAVAAFLAQRFPCATPGRSRGARQ